MPNHSCVTGGISRPDISERSSELLLRYLLVWEFAERFESCVDRVDRVSVELLVDGLVKRDDFPSPLPRAVWELMG